MGRRLEKKSPGRGGRKALMIVSSCRVVFVTICRIWSELEFMKTLVGVKVFDLLCEG